MRLLVVTPRDREVRERLCESLQRVPPPIAQLDVADQRAPRDMPRRALG